MDVFDLFAKLSLDTSEYDEGLKNAESAGSSFGSRLATATRVGVAAVAAVGTAAVAAGTSLVNSASDIAQYGDNIDKMSQKIGISAEAYQEWDAVMQHCGASIDSLQPAMKTLATQAQTGNEAFQQLGISEEEVANLSQEDLFSRVVAGLQDMEEGTERTYIASQLLGRGATELGALFNTSAEDTQAMIDRVHELGGVMSDEAVQASANFQDQLQDMQTSFAGLKRGMMSNFLPSLTTVMGGLTEVFSGNYDEGIDQISEGINEVVTNISEMIPQIVDIGMSVLEALATAILDNLPTIMPALVDLVMGIGDMIVQNLPLLIETALQLILQIAQGIAQALPQLIPTIVNVVVQIATTLLSNVDMLIETAFQLIIGLTEGVINAIPVLVERAPEIIVSLCEALVKALPKLLEVAVELIGTFVDGIFNGLGSVVDAGADIINAVKDGIFGLIGDAVQWGKDLIDNFVDGILGAAGAVWDAVGWVAGGIADFLGFSEPEKGPLSNFHTYAPDMMDLFAQGITDNEKMLQDTVAGAFDFQDIIASENTPNEITQISGGGGDIMSMLTDALSNLVVDVSIGSEKLDSMITKSIQRTNYRSGGR